MRMNIDTVIIPWKNKKDLVDIPEEYRSKINFKPVKTFEEVLEIALLKPGKSKDSKTPYDKSSEPRGVAA